MSSPLDARVGDIVARHEHLEGPLLPILHAVQDAFGYVPRDALPLIAEKAESQPGRGSGVVTFYHDFRAEPAGRHVVKLCRAEACQAVGADALAYKAKARIGADWHETRKSGVTVEPVFCLGLCACGPAALVDGEVVGRLDEAKLDAILKGWGA